MCGYRLGVRREKVVYTFEGSGGWRAATASGSVSVKAKSLAGVRAAVSEAAAAAGIDPEALTEHIEFPDKRIEDLVKSSVRASEKAKEAAEDALVKLRRTSFALNEAGYSLRDIAGMLGVSHQRASQAIAEWDPAPWGHGHGGSEA